MSGLAFPTDDGDGYQAKCTKVHRVSFDGETLWNEKDWDPKEDEPPTFECDPTDNSKMCELVYYTTDPKYTAASGQAKESSFTTNCKCSMDGETGYCGEILGTRIYADGLYNIKNILESSDCHTLDRDNWRAQKEECNNGNFDEWENAVNDLFRLNYWPYVNGKDSTIRECIYDTFKDSVRNLTKDGANQLGLNIIAAITTLVLLFSK